MCDVRLVHARVVRYFIGGGSCDFKDEETWYAIRSTARTPMQLQKDLGNKPAMPKKFALFLKSPALFLKSPALDLPPKPNGQPSHDWMQVLSFTHDELPAGRLAVRVVSQAGPSLEFIGDMIEGVAFAISELQIGGK